MRIVLSDDEVEAIIKVWAGERFPGCYISSVEVTDEVSFQLEHSAAPSPPHVFDPKDNLPGGKNADDFDDDIPF